MKRILGISAFYHDAAASLIVDGEVIAAVQEERFTRVKHTAVFPVKSIQYCLTESGLTIDELDAIVFYDKPLLTFERLLQTYYAFAPKGLISFLKAIPIWLREKLFLKKQIYDGLKEVGSYDRKKINLLFSEHHLSHAASTFFVSPYEKAAILTIDGVGEWSTATISIGEGNTITPLKEMEFPHSVGLLYSSFTYFLGFKVNSGEYKLMGLAPYGNGDAQQTKEYIESIKSKLVNIKDDGSLWMDQSYFSYATGLRMAKDKKWEQLFGFPRRLATEEVLQHHCNLAFAIQAVTEEIVLKMALTAQKLTKTKYLCMAGGVALNCVANGVLSRKKIFQDIYIQPAAGDAGGSLGAALAGHYMYFKENREVHILQDKMHGSYLGPSFSEKEIELMNRRTKAVANRAEDFDQLTQEVVSKIVDGAIVGWFQDRMEFGPRALGNRSILGSPVLPEMQKKLNLQIKYREGFRPFAPSVLLEDADKYFEMENTSPYMLMVAPIRNEYKLHIPSNYKDLPLWEKLYHPRGHFQAITHVDFSARIQTVEKEVNPKFWKLLIAMKQKSGHGMLVNTSFNVRGEPIVCAPEDAYRCFMSTEMDMLVIDNFVYIKTEQPNWKNGEKWKISFEKD